jgi:hypothetical protein
VPVLGSPKFQLGRLIGAEMSVRRMPSIPSLFLAGGVRGQKIASGNILKASIQSDKSIAEFHDCRSFISETRRNLTPAGIFTYFQCALSSAPFVPR